MDRDRQDDKGKVVPVLGQRQLQAWSKVGAAPCTEEMAEAPAPIKVGECHKTPRAHPWRPTLGYENVEAFPLPTQPTTNRLADPCYTPSGMATEPVKFPNLVTGFERNPAHGARAALYTRYTPQEWTQNQIGLYNETDSNRHLSERLRNDNVRLMREADEAVREGQRSTGRKLGERITDIAFWRNEVASELERLMTENERMQESRRILRKAIEDLEGPLHIAQECLYHRESRRGTELVHDQTEQALLEEIETIRNCQKTLEHFTDKCADQVSTAFVAVGATRASPSKLVTRAPVRTRVNDAENVSLESLKLRNGRASQNQLEQDVRDKEGALGIDTMCHRIDNFSRGLQYYAGVEKYDPCTTTAESWSAASDGTVKKSQAERSRSCELRSDIEITINAVAQEVWDAWSNTNNSLARRFAEMLEAKSKLQVHLHKIQGEIFDAEKNVELMQRAIADKSGALKVARTRLEARMHRPQPELCRDYAQLGLIREVEAIVETIRKMHVKMQQSEAQHQQLLRTRASLETDLRAKVDALFVDREKCMGMRRCYPIAATVKY